MTQSDAPRPTMSEELAADVIAFRRQLHRIPEVGLDLPLTQAAILKRLRELEGLEITTGTRQSSVTAVLRGGAAPANGGVRPVVLLRGDMDALPVTETSGLDFASEHEGSMHACGHDLHIAGLYGALRLLHASREQLAADVVFMFQPGEEAYDGARFMVEDGVLDAAGRRVDSAYGLHVFSGKFERGVFACRPGTLMAGCEELDVVVHGQGGHGSMPYLAKDPVPVACEMVLALQSMVTRQFDVFDPVVVTVGRFAAGTASNVIPETAEFDISLRVFSREHTQKVLASARDVINGVAAAHGVRAEITQAPNYPVTVNTPDEADVVAQTVADLFGAERYELMASPLPGSEDFSHVLAEVPGAFIALGATMPGLDPAQAPMNHAPQAMFDDAVLPDASVLLAELALRRGRRGVSSGPGIAEGSGQAGQ